MINRLTAFRKSGAISPVTSERPGGTFSDGAGGVELAGGSGAASAGKGHSRLLKKLTSISKAPSNFTGMEPVSPPRKAYTIKGCLWRGLQVTPPDDESISPSVRLFVVEETSGSPVWTGGGGGHVASAPPAAAPRGEANGSTSIEHSVFKSKLLRNIKKQSAEWDEKFTMCSLAMRQLRHASRR